MVMIVELMLTYGDDSDDEVLIVDVYTLMMMMVT